MDRIISILGHAAVDVVVVLVRIQPLEISYA